MGIKGNVENEVVDIHGNVSLVLKGDDGESAYEVAVRNGFVGTEAEWLASLKGEATKAEAATAEALVWRNSAKGYATEAGNHEEAAKGYRNECQTIKDSIAPQVTQAITAIQAEKAEAEAKKALVDEAAAHAHLDRVQADADAAEVRHLHGDTIIQKNVATDAAERARRYAIGHFDWDELEGLPTTRDGYGITDVPKTDGTDATGTWDIDITGDATTVNEHTVEADVPPDAVFTDTTYHRLTAEEAAEGTATTARAITAKVLADYVADVVATAVTSLVNSSPATLDTLKELADAIGEDPNFATTMTTALAGKLGKTETAVNAEKVNNLTVETAVPENAVFTDTTYNNATTSTAGLMSTTDKAKLDGVESGAQVNTITGVKGSAESSYRIGNVNITKANIGLGNVDNTADIDKSVASAQTANNVAWSGVTNKPTTLEGYGITNAPTKTGTGASGTWGIDINGNAETVNGLTVETAVPANAKFTDTTYDVMTSSELSDGTSTQGKLIDAHTLATFILAVAADVVNNAPEALDTLAELAQALGDDPNFATTVMNEIGKKLDKSGGVITGNLTVNGTLTGNIVGSASKVNNHTVESDVPANAKFTDTTYSNATTSKAGLMSSTDKTKLDGIESGAQVNTVTGVKGNSESTYRTGNVNITKANIGLGNVENTADSAKSVAYAATAGDASTVSGFTVGKAVPSDAKFTDTTYNNATISTAGLMSAADKGKLDGIASGAQVNSVTGVKGNSESSYRTGNINITKANIGLGNVDNTADANKSVSYADNAGTVNGHTVNADVPSGAKFTDTTYSAMSASEATTGTATTARTITAKVLADYVAACIATLVNSAPAALDTLQELADALGNDPNFATTMATALGNKLDKTGTAVNAEKVNNLTVQTAVPANAKFTDTTYSNFVKSGSGAKAGLVPAPSTTAGTTKYLREDGTWQVPPDNNTTYTAASAAPLANGTAAVGTSTKYAREDHVHPLQTSVSGSSGSCTGNAATATKLATARTINIQDSSATNTGTGASFDGSGNATIKLPATIKANITGNVSGSSGSCTGNAANVTGTVAIEHGGTGATTRLGALKNLTNENVGTGSKYFLTITDNYGKGGYASVANVKSVLGIKNFVKSGSTAEAGLVPAPSTTAGTTHYLREDGTWTVPPNTTYSNFVKSGSGAKAGLVPSPGTTAGTTKYLREDGTWQVPPNTTYGVATSSANGLMSKTDKATLDAIPNSYATQAQVDQLATTATNSVSAAVSAKNDAVTAKNQAQSIANGLVSIRDTAVDTSLAISGQAADSKTVGDKFAVIGATSATNNEYLCVWLDSANRVLFGVKADGSFYWQKGIPKVLKDELDGIKARLSALEG